MRRKKKKSPQNTPHQLEERRPPPPQKKEQLFFFGNWVIHLYDYQVSDLNSILQLYPILTAPGLRSKKMSIITPRSNSSPFSAFLRTRSLSLLRFIIPSLSVISLIWVLFHHSRSGLNATLSQAFQKLRPSSSSSPPPPRVIIKLDPKNFTDEALLGLPILPRTSNDPFDPLNQYRALPDSYTPWNESTSRGSILLDRLREPPISKPPPTEIWPPSTLVQPRFIKPIPHDQILHFSDASSSTLPLIPHSKNSKSFQVQWSGFKHPRRSWETRDQEKIRNQRRTWVKNAFLHNWESYKSQAWGHDELMPVSGNVGPIYS